MIEPKFYFGSAVVFVKNGIPANGLVLQSNIQTVVDRTAPEGVRFEEHVIVLYLKPSMAGVISTSADLDRAITKEHGVLVRNDYDESVKSPYVFAERLDDADVANVANSFAAAPGYNPHPELVQFSPAHRPYSYEGRKNIPEGVQVAVAAAKTASREEVSARASELSKEHGGDDKANWLEAEKEVNQEHAQQASANLDGAPITEATPEYPPAG